MGKTSGSGNQMWREAGHRYARSAANKKQSIENLRKAGLLASDVCRRQRFAQLEHEEAEAAKLALAGYTVLSPTAVCDRIAVKDGKVFFVEFKFIGQRLRYGQKIVQALVPEAYMVRYAERARDTKLKSEGDRE